MQKLRLVNPTALFLAAVAIVLFIATARLRGSFLGTYSSTGVAAIPSTPQDPGLAATPAGSRGRRNTTSPFAGRPAQCGMFLGEWVPDDAAPYYTNQTCALIQEHQNCMKYGRPDLGFLRWRWRPEGKACELPRFDAAAFLRVVRNQSMVFVGDSLARNQMLSLVCLLSKVEYPRDISPTENQGFRKLYYESHGFTLSIFRSPFLVKANLSGNGSDRDRGVWNLYLDEPDDAWLPFVSGSDYIIISAAIWFTHPSMFYEAGGRLVGCQACDVPGVPELTLRYSMRAAFRTALRAITGLEGFTGTAILRTLTPTSQFDGGEWDKGGDCRRTRPYVERYVDGLDLELHEAQVQEFVAAERELEQATKRGKSGGVRMMLLDTTFAMVMRPEGHPSGYRRWAHENVTLYNDCVHWCLPGPVDVWNEMLLQMLLDA